MYIKEIKSISELYENPKNKDDTIGIIIDVQGTYRCGKDESKDFLTIIKV